MKTMIALLFIHWFGCPLVDDTVYLFFLREYGVL
jgi:hypothetical protein